MPYTPNQQTNANNTVYKEGTNVFKSDGTPIDLPTFQSMGLNFDHINEKGAINPNIPVNQIQPATSMTFSSQQTRDASGALVAGAEVDQQGIQKYLDMIKAPKSDAQMQSDAVSGQLNDLLGRPVDYAKEQMDAESQYGIPEKQKQLENVNSELQQKMAEYKKMQLDYEKTYVQQDNQPILGSIAQGQAAQTRKLQAIENMKYGAEIGLLQAQAQAIQGNIENAQKSADRAVDLKYKSQQDTINAKLKQLDLIEGKLSKEEATRSQALKLYLQEQQDKLDVLRAYEKDKNSTLLNLLQSYPDAGITLTDTLEQASAKVASSRIYQDKVRGPVGRSSGGGGGGGVKSMDNTPTAPTEPEPQYSPVNGNGTISKGGEWKYMNGAWQPNGGSSRGTWTLNSAALTTTAKLKTALSTIKLQGGERSDAEASLQASNLNPANFTVELDSVFGKSKEGREV